MTITVGLNCCILVNMSLHILPSYAHASYIIIIYVVTSQFEVYKASNKINSHIHILSLDQPFLYLRSFLIVHTALRIRNVHRSLILQGIIASAAVVGA